jgi:hypothetical protein
MLLETSMKRIYATAIAVSATLLLASAAHAQVTLNSVRIGAKDTVALAKFYQAAFGMQEVNRIDAPGGPEIFVNFGATIDAAKANKSEPIVIMYRDSDARDPQREGHGGDSRRHQSRRRLDGRRSASVQKHQRRHRHRDRSGRQPP